MRCSADSDIALHCKRKRAHGHYDKMIAGERVIVGECDYDEIIAVCGSRDRIDELASCVNRNRCGVLDEYVAWIGHENKPLDLELGACGSLYAVGSA